MSRELESLRKKAIVSKVVGHLVCLLPALFLIVGFGFSEDGGIVAALAGGLIFYSMLRVLYVAVSKNRAYTQFVQMYKAEMVMSALGGATIYEDMKFNFTSGLAPQAVTDSGIFTTNRFYSDCFISGKYNGVDIIQSDIRNVSGQKNSGFSLEYDGTYMIIPTYLPDSTYTIIFKKNVDVSVVLRGSKYMTGNQGFDGMFDTYSTNHEAAKTLLTEDFMSKLMSIQNFIPGRIAVSVRNGFMYIFVSRHGSVLKPKLFGKFDENMRNNIINELSRAKYFVDAFGRR